MKFSISFPLLLFLSLCSLKGHMLLPLLCAVILHETGHLAALWALGGKIEEINANIKGVAIKICSKGIRSAKEIISLNLAGPILGLTGAFIAWGIYLKDFAKISFFLSIFNLLPFKGLDGGEIFDEIDEMKEGLRGKNLIKTVWTLSLILIFIFAFKIK